MEEVGRLQELEARASMRLVEEEAVQADQHFRLVLALWVEEAEAFLRLQRLTPDRKSLSEAVAEEHHYYVQEVEVGPRICVCLRTAAAH